MSFREFVAAVRHEAQAVGINVPMSRLNDAIALACCNHPYAAVVAAENAGKPTGSTLPPPYVKESCERFRIDEDALRGAFANALSRSIVGHFEKSSDAVPFVFMWLETRYEVAFYTAMQHAFFTHLTERQATKLEQVTTAMQLPIDSLCRFWVLCDGWIDIKGHRQRTTSVVLGPDGLALTPAAREWIEKLSTTTLRAYIITGVDPGISLTVKDAVAHDARPIVVSEHAGSQSPELVGNIIGARLIDCGDHIELSGEIYQFAPFKVPKLLDVLALARDEEEYNRCLRHIWEEQYYEERGPLRFADSHTGEAIMLVETTYACADWPALCRRMAKRRDMEGDEHGWMRRSPGKDGELHFFASVRPGKRTGTVVVFYQSRANARKGRRWFSTLAGDSIQFLDETTVDPTDAGTIEAALAASDEGEQTITLPPEIMSKVFEQYVHQFYANFPDKPIPALDGLTPRQMMTRPDGEERVRALLRVFEANELQMAQREGRPAVSYGFLWEAMGLSETPSEKFSRNVTQLHPSPKRVGPVDAAQFEVGEAWIVFQLNHAPIDTLEKGSLNIVALMDAGSTYLFGYVDMSAETGVLTPDAARKLLETGLKKSNGRQPRTLLVPTGQFGEALPNAAKHYGISVDRVSEHDLEPCIGSARRSMEEHFSQRIGRAP